MQPQHSKTHTVLLLVLVLMAGVIIGLLLSDSRAKVEAPVVTPVQNPVTEPEKNVTAQATPEQESNYEKLLADKMNNRTNLLNELNVPFKTYTNNNFSFDYYGKANVKIMTGDIKNPSYSVNEPNGDFPDEVMFFNGPIPKEYNSCSSENVKLFNVQVKTTTINGKTFTYCDSTQGEPVRTYIYTKNNKNIVAYILMPITNTSQKPQGGYVNISSIEIK